VDGERVLDDELGDEAPEFSISSESWAAYLEEAEEAAVKPINPWTLLLIILGIWLVVRRF